MQVQIIESNRGGKIALHDDGHSYNQKQSTNNCIHWRCTKYYKLKCPAILKTKNETVIETKGTHNHDPGECKAKEVVNQIKRNELQSWQNTGRLREGSAECFQQKNPPRRNLVLLFPPDAIF